MPAASHIVNQLEVRVTGMSRSGNHAIINWILQQAGPRYCFLNCTEPKHNPFGTARPLANDGPGLLTDIEELSIDRELAGDHALKNLLLFSHEDTFLGPLGSARWERCRDRWVGRTRRRVDLLVVRDPFNLFASRFQFGLSEQPARHSPFSPLARRIWQQHARQVLGERQIFPGEWRAVSYNRWTLERDYRKELAGWLGLSFTDEGLEEVARCAGGSSFDGLARDALTLRHHVHDRWRLLRMEPAYRTFFDETTRELAGRCFPECESIGNELDELQSQCAG